MVRLPSFSVVHALTSSSAGRSFLFHDERVIARGRHGRGQAAEDGLVVVGDGAGLAVHQVRSAHDVAAKSRADGLMSQADAENRNFAGEVPDQIDADAGVLRRARTRRDHDALRLHGLDLGNCDLVVAANLDLRAQFPEVLNQVVGKGIVVVENENHEAPILAYSLPPERATPVPKGGIDGTRCQRHSWDKLNATSLALE